MKIVFFGSTSDSVLVLQKLSRADIAAVVTQPPKPVGRKQILTPTPVETWAREREIPVSYTAAPSAADLIISASYGEKIPMEFIRAAKFGGLNVHPSLLPRWRGGDPVPWAILSGDHQIGVSVSTLSDTFDAGNIIAQKKISITPHDTSGPLRTKLFAMGAGLLIDALPDYLSGKNKGRDQRKGNEPYARRFTREDGFEPWERITDPKESERLHRKFRALHPWPGLWTRLPAPGGVATGGQGTFQGKRIKILDFGATPKTVQMEGKTPVSWAQFQKAYITS